MKNKLFFFIFFLFCSLKSYEKKLKILFFTNKFPYALRCYINNQIIGLLEMGHDVYIFSKKVGGYIDNQQVSKYNLLERTFYNTIPKHIRDCDILYNQFGGMGNLCLKLQEKFNLTGKLVVCLRGDDASKELKQNPHRYDKLFKKADLFLPVCENFKNRIIQHGCKKNKIIVHHSAIDCSQFNYVSRLYPEDGIIKIITVARLEEMKGFDYALRAINKLRFLYPNIRYEIIGEGKQHIYLEELIKLLHLEPYVKLSGYNMHDKIVEKLNKAHIFLLTSITTEEGEQEGIPNALMEAMSVGLPVVATRHSGIQELVKDGDSGFLVPEKNVNLLVEKLYYLISRTDLWSIMGRKGSEFVNKEFNKIILNDKLISIFKNLI